MASENILVTDAIVIGGGLYGATLALLLRQQGERVLLLEKEPDLLRRASAINQARVHQGYHYPRSILTALRSHVHFARFLSDFSDCVDDSYIHYYAIGKTLSNVTAQQFRSFCRRINAPLEPASKRVKALFNTALVEDVFLVRESIFNADLLRIRLKNQLQESGVQVLCGAEATHLERSPAGIVVSAIRDNTTTQVVARHVFNCTYAGINRLLENSRLPTVPLKHELAEMALVEVPEEYRSLGITLMCGPFFSLLPFPSRAPGMKSASREMHVLSHVRYTPHYAWESSAAAPSDDYLARQLQQSQYLYMIKDAARYVPGLRDARYLESLWEIKTVMRASEMDDSRPILFLKDHGMPGLATIMGGKIDNIYDMFEEIRGAYFPALGHTR